MKLAIIGASAGIGLETVKRALQRGHAVTTLSRSAIPLPDRDGMHAVIGSATNKADLSAAIEGADAIVVTLGTGKNMKTTTLFSDFGKVLVEIQKEKGIDAPVLAVTGFGAGDSQTYATWFVRMFLKYFLKDVYADKTKMEEMISHSLKKWVIVRPGRLLDEALTEKYRIETTLFKGINIGGINRADVADFLVKQAENPTHLGKYVSIAAK